MNLPRIHALVPAAGLSGRFGGTILKQYAHLLGKPVIAYSIEAMKHHPAVSAVTVAVAEDDGIYDELIRPRYTDVGTVVGGASRAHTVMKGLQHILSTDSSAEWVLVHDAARPCLQPRMLDDLIAAGMDNPDGALLAVPLNDTVKRAAGDGRIQETLSRDRLWAAQTPQFFPLRRLAEALSEALESGQSPTDEAAAMERTGARPSLVMGSQTNLKITRPDDLWLAEAALQSLVRNQGRGRKQP